MLPSESPLTKLQRELREGSVTAAAVAEQSLARANGNFLRNTYLRINEDKTRDDARTLPAGPLHGVPISLKDCFDFAGTRTTFGSRFYAGHNPVVAQDSAVVERLRACGALITGKTHLQPLAYGITGQNADFGDCLQPRDRALLTGGSSSGAAASVQEGSALAAIGTDTGGSIRVPAVLCGLSGFRASHAMADADGAWPEMWRGSMALAPSFDTLGLIFRDPRDAETLAQAIFRLPAGKAPAAPRIGCVPEAYFHDATPEVLAAYGQWREFVAACGATLDWIDPSPWAGAIPIFTAIQAHEAAQVHAGHFEEFGALISQRLNWGASISPEELRSLRAHHAEFRGHIRHLFDEYDFVMLPSANTGRLLAAEDQSATRAAMLRYTTPFSLGGLPCVSLPGELIGAGFGTGVQVAAASGNDPMLLALMAELGRRIADA